MKQSARSARLVTFLGLVLAVLGTGGFAVGLALFDAGAFPLLTQGSVFVATVVLALGPCLLLVNTLRLVHHSAFSRAVGTCAMGGLALLGESTAAALFTTISNPCWDAPACTSAVPLSHIILEAATGTMFLAAIVALVLAPVLLAAVREVFIVERVVLQ